MDRVEAALEEVPAPVHKQSAVLLVFTVAVVVAVPVLRAALARKALSSLLGRQPVAEVFLS